MQFPLRNPVDELLEGIFVFVVVEAGGAYRHESCREMSENHDENYSVHLVHLETLWIVLQTVLAVGKYQFLEICLGIVGRILLEIKQNTH